MRHWLLYTAVVAIAFLPSGCQTAQEVKPESPNRHEGSKVRIDGVPNMTVGNVNDDWTALLKGVHVLLTHREEQTTLDEVMACAGDAFNLCHGERWELRTLHTVPTDTLSNVAKAYGYEGRWIPPRFFWELKRLKKEEREAESDRFLAQIWSEIDAGRPVLMGGTHGLCASWRVVVGCDRQNEKICYMGGEQAYEWTDLRDAKVKEIGFWDMQIRGTTRKGHSGGWIANTAFLLGEKKRDVPDEERATMALRLAADLHRAEPFRTEAYGEVTYYFGAQAYEQWAKDLHELDYPADRKKPRPKVPECYDMSQQWFQADQIVRGRSAAAAFCEKAAGALPEAKTELLAAARAYRDEVAIAREAFGALLSGSDDQREAWVSDEAKREAGVAAIRRMLEKERTAIAETEKALETVNPETTATADAAAKPSTATKKVTEKPIMKREGVKVWIEGVPRGARGNRYARSVSILLESVAVSADYDEIMGRSGLAFITQAQDGQPLIDGAVDVGWWPLDPWGFYMRHDFVGRAYGWSVSKIECDPDAYRADAAKHYRERFEPALREAISAARPAIAVQDGCFVVRGYDDQEPPLLGNWSCSDAAEDVRIPGYPWGLIALGKEEEPMAPADVDREALRYAVALFRDDGTPVTAACPSERPPTCFTGRRAFELWIKALRDTKNLGQARWHANMVFNLRINRRCAVAYLRSMASRYEENVAKHLSEAAGLYQKELALLNGADTSKTALIVKPAGREELAKLVEQLAQTEGEAIAAIERALAADLGKGLTAEQFERLAQWGNMWGKLDGCIRAAGRDPVYLDLLREELALEPLSDDARQVRNKMHLEPADSCYPAQIEALLRSIAAGKLTGPWPPARTPEREARLKKLSVALRAWSDGTPQAEASKREGTDAATVEEVYGYLGALDDDKKAAVAITVEKLEKGHSERAVKIERKGLDNPETLEEALAHNVSMCDTQCWTFEHNLKVLLTRIGNKTMDGGWSEPDGPIGWSGPRAMNPELKPRLTAIVGGLKVWIAGKPGEGESKQVAEQLGKRDAYKEKVWLAKCLHNYLSHHVTAAGY